jgi:hypothetical protein
MICAIDEVDIIMLRRMATLVDSAGHRLRLNMGQYLAEISVAKLTRKYKMIYNLVRWD